MLGVVVMLLIAAMTAQPMIGHAKQLDLATVQNATTMPGASRDDATVVALTRDGKVFLGTTMMAIVDLKDGIQEKMKQGGEKRLFMKVDARAKYGDVGTVLDEVRKSGVWRVSFLVEQMQRPLVR